ncbi:MAG: (deoxy)nucleoside triphosphate pyrophosphohydrolase [Planctomycetes bacterium]|nr:(deoxy)nucleoside triphosphate pyrophosphohydrolase [Planctomycetota bacterium]
MTDQHVTPIGIAVVEHRGRYLVGTRPSDTVLPGRTEFPGGKCRPNEPPDACAVRECHEETGLRVIAVRELLRCQFDYPHGRVDLHFWLCRLAVPPAAEQAQPPATPHGYRWLTPDELAREPLPEANAPVILLLRKRKMRPRLQSRAKRKR